MNFSLTIGSKTFSLNPKAFPTAFQSVNTTRGVMQWLHEISTGGWQRNEDVNIDTVLTNPTLFACVTLIAGDIAKLRPMLVEQDEDRTWTEIDSAAFSPVLDQPNSYQAWPDYVEWYLESKLVAGNVYVLKERDQRGVVRALYVLNPYRVIPLIAPDGSVFYQCSPEPLADVQESIIVPAREIIHDRMCPLFHPLVGISPIYAAGFPAMDGLSLRQSAAKFVSNGARPGGILMVPGTMKQEDADKMKEAWRAGFSGSKQGEIALLTGGMSYLPMGQMTAEQSRLIEQLNMTDEDIAKCFHMPRHKVGIGPDPTYTNIEAKNQDYYNDCLQKHINKFQIDHTKGLGLDNVVGRTLAVHLNIDDLLLMDTLAKSDVAAKAVTSGLSFNETRFRFWGVGPVAGGESPMTQQQNFSLEALARRDATSTPTSATPAPVTPQPQEPPVVKAIDVIALPAMIRQKLAELRPAA